MTTAFKLIHVMKKPGTDEFVQTNIDNATDLILECATAGRVVHELLDEDIDFAAQELHDHMALAATAELTVSWIDADGAPHNLGPHPLQDLVAYLGDAVADDTPEDARDTDDHPLERARLILDLAANFIADDPAPDPSP